MKLLSGMVIAYVGRYQEFSNFAGKVRTMEKLSTIDLLEAGLRAESLRQRVIANNIANLETANYRTLDVKFKELLAKALESPGGISPEQMHAELVQTGKNPIKTNGNDVNLEAEVGKMITNSLTHKAFIRLLSKKYRQMELAMNVSNG